MTDYTPDPLVHARALAIAIDRYCDPPYHTTPEIHEHLDQLARNRALGRSDYADLIDQ